LITQRNNVSMSILPIGFSQLKSKPITDCSTCKHEKSNMECGHPKNGTKAWEKMDESQCWCITDTLTQAQKYYSKSGRQND